MVHKKILHNDNPIRLESFNSIYKSMECIEMIKSNFEAVLVCNESIQSKVMICVNVNRSLLSSSSPVFEAMLRKLETVFQNQPYIFLFGVSKETLEDTVYFMQYNEVDLPLTRIAAFIKLAKRLKIKGMPRSHKIYRTIENTKQISKDSKTMSSFKIKSECLDSSIVSNHILPLNGFQFEYYNYIKNGFQLEYSNYINSCKDHEMITLGLNVSTLLSASSESSWKCKICQYSASQETKVKNHVMTNHIKNKSFKCSNCQKDYHSLKAYKRHIYKSFSCKYCIKNCINRVDFKKHNRKCIKMRMNNCK